MEKTLLRIAVDSLRNVTTTVDNDAEKYGIQPGHQELLDISKTAALIDIADSLHELLGLIRSGRIG